MVSKLLIGVLLAYFLAIPAVLLADPHPKKLKLKVPANATSIDFITTVGDVGGSPMLPVLKDPSGMPISYNYSLGGAGAHNELRNFGGIISGQLPAGNYSLELDAPQVIKEVRIWYDFLGMPVDFTTPAIQTVASLNIIPGPGYSTIGGENLTGTSAYTVGQITATLFTDLSSYNSPNWDTIPGTDLTFTGGSLPVGSDGVLFGTFASNSNQWVRLTSTINGAQQVSGEFIVPEPGAVALLFSACLAGVIFVLRRRHCRSPSRFSH